MTLEHGNEGRNILSQDLSPPLARREREQEETFGRGQCGVGRPTHSKEETCGRGQCGVGMRMNTPKDIINNAIIHSADWPNIPLNPPSKGDFEMALGVNLRRGL